MKLTIIKDDGIVIVNGRSMHVDLSDLPASLHAVQWNGVTGHVEHTDKANTPLVSVAAYQVWLDRWEAARATEDAPQPPKTPEQIKAAAIAAIDAEKDAALAAGFSYRGYLYHCDPVFQGQVTSYVVGFESGLTPAGASVPIRRKDNTNVMMTYPELFQFAAALMPHVQNIYIKSWTAKDALV